VLCRREKSNAPAPSRRGLLGIAAAVTALVGGAIAARAIETRSPASVIAPDIRAAPVQVTRAPPSQVEGPNRSPNPARDQRLHEFREAVANAGQPPIEPAGAPTTPPEPPAPPAPTPAAPALAPISDVHVVVYTTPWCPVCKQAKAWMVGHGVAFEERDIEASSDNARKILAINPRSSIPTFDVEGDVMVGFSEEQLVAMMQRAADRQATRRRL
jgi:glutaredoxin 3